MANFVYTTAKKGLMDGIIDLTGDIRALLVMTNTTCDTEKDKTFLDQFTTLDEMDGAGYARAALAAEAVVADNPNDRGEFDATDLTFATVSNGTRQVAGLVLFLFVTNDTDSIPIAFIDDDAPYDPGGGNIVYSWNAEGILQLT